MCFLSRGSLDLSFDFFFFFHAALHCFSQRLEKPEHEPHSSSSTVSSPSSCLLLLVAAMSTLWACWNLIALHLMGRLRLTASLYKCLTTTFKVEWKIENIQ